MDDAETYATWFAALGDPTRVRVLQTIASASAPLPVGVVAERVGIAQPTASHHIRVLADTGFVQTEKQGTSTLVRVDDTCRVALPHAADAVMGLLGPVPPALHSRVTDASEQTAGAVVIRPMTDADWPAVREVYAQGIATGAATFRTCVPGAQDLDARWLPGHRWIAEVHDDPGGPVFAGWASLTGTPYDSCGMTLGESSVYVHEAFRGRRVGLALARTQVREADRAGLVTLQAQIFPANRTSLRLFRTVGFRTVGIRERIGRLDGEWRDVVLVERRAPSPV